MSAASSPSTTFLQKSQSSVIVSLLSIPHTVRFPLENSTVSYKSRQFSSQYPYAAVSPEEEEESVIGDFLVYEEGIFSDPSLVSRDYYDARVTSSSHKYATVSPENLIPEEWLNVQKELNITKKERRFIAQQMEYGRKVEQRRQDLKPINFEEYEKFKQDNLKQLKPVILDNPKFEHVEENEKQRKSEDRKNGEEKSDRVGPRNPRLAVYGGGLEAVSSFFSSGRYDPAAADKSQGTRKLFSKEEKLLMNKRVPDLAAATSGKWHPLHTLVAGGEFYLLNSLLKHNLDINAPDKNGLTAIHKAILAKKQAVFNFLLRESTNPFVRDEDGATLMHYAVFTASDQMIKILLLYNVDINLQDNDGWTPLHLAVQSRRTDIVRLLLIKGADRSLKNQDGLTALDLCLCFGRDIRTYELIKLLKRQN